MKKLEKVIIIQYLKKKRGKKVIKCEFVRYYHYCKQYYLYYYYHYYFYQYNYFYYKLFLRFLIMYLKRSKGLLRNFAQFSPCYCY